LETLPGQDVKDMLYLCPIMEHKLKSRHIRITTWQEKQFEKLSKLTGLTVSELIRRALDDYIERRLPDVSYDTGKPSQRI